MNRFQNVQIGVESYIYLNELKRMMCGEEDARNAGTNRRTKHCKRGDNGELVDGTDNEREGFN
jgi:hypothetical protein